MSTTITARTKNIKESLRLDSRTFFEKATTYSTGSVAQERIGLQVNRNIVSVNVITTDSTIGGIQEGPIKVIDNTIINNLNSFRYGKDVKSVKNLLNDKLVPNITLGKENNISNDDHIDHSLEFNSYGQNSLFKTFDYENERFIPFEDFEGKPEAKSFIGLIDADKRGFPYVYNRRRNYDKFRNPDPAALDGAIEVFAVRDSPANTGIIDLQIKGARGLFGVGNWELTQHTTYGKKGSPFLSEKFEIKQSLCDFFEDADESILNVPVEGYVSSGIYKSSPFVERENYLKNSYEHLTTLQKLNLVSGSTRDDSETGTRFKSTQNGLIITPFYQLCEQRSFGTDSIAFSGLLKG
jgi:hypothetical protein